MATDGTHPDIPDKQWTNPFSEGTWLHETFDEVVRQNRDLIVIISDLRGRRGTGKSIASLKLGDQMDQTEQGLTYSKCTMSAEELRNAYSNQPERSGLVLDEAEVAAGNRDAMTITNKALREIASMGRVEQKYLIANVPIKGFIDKDILKLADVWIAMERRGLGLVHHLKWEPYSETLFTEKKQRIRFDDIETGTDLRDVYNKLTREKRRHITGEEGQKFVPKEDHEDALERARREARQDARNEAIQDIYRHFKGITDDDITRLKQADGLPQPMLGDAVGLGRKQINNIVNQ